ncbi:MAG: methylenetetrahydrofolate reductase C-terminal domain-containing protein [Caldilineaceae bacterium]|nr:methylenetetrahydrofolate reductase C-terminal domain-containing protein [Caldilineaceae bacterium]MBP8108474.1 methylenetetrahydrofolate reductase C-terminal domain-containing protein [Caldilineaceae bacterium]MBP8123699.1 methylenetetrahydrofolate reductase C-terminal domain-containing protein [Caldilineaceae bacterium]MBP9073825.1 methylenetetrahydrofolate reductase C-terminal domain-containing protein [Caldilineaceae bacterium]
MSIFSPPRYQAPFHPVRKDTLPTRVFTSFERSVKGALFGCRMCGNCILQETAYICPMTCAMGLRNGLCGGATSETCCVDPSRPCTWYLIYDRAERLGMTDKLLEINAPLDGNRVGHETWIDMLQKWRNWDNGPRPIELITDPDKFKSELNQFFYDLRQPDWWQGDAEYHPPAYTEPVSELEAALRTGKFVVTGEIAPPLGASTKQMERKVASFKNYVTAANFTDNASASARMNSIASSKICLDLGLEPVMQLQGRDRSRVAIEADALGAAGLGIHNLLCLSGDPHSNGPSPMTVPNQSDLDAVQILWMLRRMRDEGRYLDGREIKQRPQWFLGAAASPFGAPPKYEAIRAEKKVNAGAQFIQTQPIFDYDHFTEWLEALDKRNLLDKVYILPGVIPLKSARAAHFMDDEVRGVVLPSAVIARMDAAGDDPVAQQETGVAIALEIIERFKQTPGIAGMHVMAVHWEEIVPRLLEESGLATGGLEKL